MGTFWKSAQTAYTGWWTLLGIVAASISGFNLLRKVLDIGLSGAIQAIVTAYQSVVHPPIRAIFTYLHLAPPPDWAVDVGIFWLLIAGVVLRSAWAIRAATISENVRMGGPSKFWSELMQERLMLPSFLLLAVFAWPYYVWMLLSNPHVIRYKRSRSFSPRSSPDVARGAEYYCDMRIVMALHAATAVVCIVAWAALNVLLD